MWAQALEIASLKAEIATTRHIIAEDEKTLTLIKTKFSIGSGTKIDILNAEASLEIDSALLHPLEQRLNVAQHVLAVLVDMSLKRLRLTSS